MVESISLVRGGGGGTFKNKIWNALRERLRTHKVLTKDQCFYLNYHKFSIKSYVLNVSRDD